RAWRSGLVTDASPVALCDRADEGEAQARASVVGAAVTESLEQAPGGVFGQTGPLIADAEDADRAAVFFGAAQADLNGSAAGAVFQGVVQQIGGQATQQGGIALNQELFFAVGRQDADALLRRLGPQDVGGVHRHLTQVHEL